MTRQEPLEEILTRAGMLDDATLARARELQQRDGGSLGKVLADLGVAADGLEGLEVARRDRPQVIVSDVNMPGLDGIAMVKALREDPLTRGAAILMLTSEASVETETRGLETGADDYILKPVEPRRLAARVKSLMSRLQSRMTAAS